MRRIKEDGLPFTYQPTKKNASIFAIPHVRRRVFIRLCFIACFVLAVLYLGWMALDRSETWWNDLVLPHANVLQYWHPKIPSDTVGAENIPLEDLDVLNGPSTPPLLDHWKNVEPNQPFIMDDMTTNNDIPVDPIRPSLLVDKSTSMRRPDDLTPIKPFSSTYTPLVAPSANDDWQESSLSEQYSEHADEDPWNPISLSLTTEIANEMQVDEEKKPPFYGQALSSLIDPQMINPLVKLMLHDVGSTVIDPLIPLLNTIISPTKAKSLADALRAVAENKLLPSEAMESTFFPFFKSLTASWMPLTSDISHDGMALIEKLFKGLIQFMESSDASTLVDMASMEAAKWMGPALGFNDAFIYQLKTVISSVTSEAVAVFSNSVSAPADLRDGLWFNRQFLNTIQNAVVKLGSIFVQQQVVASVVSSLMGNKDEKEKAENGLSQFASPLLHLASQVFSSASFRDGSSSAALTEQPHMPSSLDSVDVVSSTPVSLKETPSRNTDTSLSASFSSFLFSFFNVDNVNTTEIMDLKGVIGSSVNTDSADPQQNALDDASLPVKRSLSYNANDVNDSQNAIDSEAIVRRESSLKNDHSPVFDVDMVLSSGESSSDQSLKDDAKEVKLSTSKGENHLFKVSRASEISKEPISEFNVQISKGHSSSLGSDVDNIANVKISKKKEKKRKAARMSRQITAVKSNSQKAISDPGYNHEIDI